MAGETIEIKKALKELTKSDEEVYSIVCTVDSVNLTNKTCYCLPIDESRADLLGVRLIADIKTGLLIIPKVNSVVVVTMIDKSSGYVAMFSEVDSIALNGEANGGLVKIDNLILQLNTQLTALKAAISAGFAAIVVDSGTGSAAYNASVASVQNLNKTPLENTTVKHGEGIT